MVVGGSSSGSEAEKKKTNITVIMSFCPFIHTDVC